MGLLTRMDEQARAVNPNLSEAQIRQKLAQINGDLLNASLEFPDLTNYLPGPPRLAAVLIPLLKQDQAWHVLFTRRADDLHEHKGQVAFPGGRMDPEDGSLEDTALREAQEEIGLAPGDVRILGRLNDYLTITNYQVTPVVGVMPWPYLLRPSEHEVSRVFTIPLAWLADPRNHEIRQHKIKGKDEPVPVVFFSPYAGETLWGASARFTLRLLEVLSLS